MPPNEEDQPLVEPPKVVKPDNIVEPGITENFEEQPKLEDLESSSSDLINKPEARTGEEPNLASRFDQDEESIADLPVINGKENQESKSFEPASFPKRDLGTLPGNNRSSSMNDISAKVPSTENAQPTETESSEGVNNKSKELFASDNDGRPSTVIMPKKNGAKKILIILLVLILLAGAGFAGWYFFLRGKGSDQQVKKDDKKTAQTEETKPDFEVVAGPSEQWSTYKNYKAGFSIDFPKQFYANNGAPCEDVTATAKNKQPDTKYYKAVVGQVDGAILQEDDNFYVTSAEAYDLGQADSAGQYTTCQKTKTTVDMVKKVTAGQDNKYPTTNLKFVVKQVDNQDQILEWAKSYFGSSNLTIASTTDNSKGWKDIELACSPEKPLCLNFVYLLRYYPEKSKMFYFESGQAVVLSADDKPADSTAGASTDSFYDSKIPPSFKLL